MALHPKVPPSLWLDDVPLCRLRLLPGLVAEEARITCAIVDAAAKVPSHSGDAPAVPARAVKNFSSTAHTSGTWTVATSHTIFKSTLA